MNENTKGLLKTLAVAAGICTFSILAMLGNFAGTALALGDGDFRIPLDANRNLPASPEWSGYSVSSRTSVGTQMTNSSVIATEVTSGKLWATTAGVLRQVYISTGAATEFVVCFDTSTAHNSLNVFLDSLSAVRLIQPHFTNTTNATCAMSGGAGGGCPPLDIEFRKGLWCHASNNQNIRYFPVFRLKGD